MIKINITNANKSNSDLAAFISFPYDNNIVSVMRQQSERYWDANNKQWEIPYRKLDKVIEQLDGYEMEITEDICVETPKVSTHIDFDFKTEPFAHQVEGFNFGLEHDRFLLGDEQGLGKTKQVIDIAVAKKLAKGYKHCLIVCGVNGLKWNWASEIATHSNEESWILGQRNKRGKVAIEGNASRLKDLENINSLPYFIITNVETLRQADICNKIAALCKDGTIGMVAADEVHKMKNPASQQGKAFLKILPETRIAMTGTPLMNTPIDLFIILKWLGYEKHSLYQFKNHYCVMGGYGGYEIVGYKNLGELRERMEEIMLRRLKSQVLDLPEKIHTTEYVEMNAAQAVIYKEVKEELKANIDKIKISNNPLAQLIRLRQATGYTGILSSQIAESAKLDRLEEIVEELAESGEKCIIFSNWTDVTSPAFKRLKKYNPAIITGETKDRVAEQNKFMNDPKCKCIIGTIGAMGTGLTLTAASTVIFLDSPWNRANKEQAEDRAHRIGTKSTVNIITIVCKDTIDERIEELVYKKGLMADALVDGRITEGREQVVDFLLS